MHADTAAIRALAHTDAAHSTDLAAAAAALNGVPVTAAASSLGPVGARFLAALSAAATAESATAAALADRVAGGAAAARSSATAYDRAQMRATALLGA
ncbi:hypothetical protein AU196_05730 [Mycobacterium sp. IS-1742]|uniref:type VII secretion target n=1 Tax=Mycobacterium sp. IS-1742 TaxID=1772285 RepID=UPI000740352C|nr:type VII secretion target [Mycobacterium sp. IS-1742]KUI30107.1 hypothetical protein AU196_05730 [Mycobacterium sp. IS-1742]